MIIEDNRPQRMNKEYKILNVIKNSNENIILTNFTQKFTLLSRLINFHALKIL